MRPILVAALCALFAVPAVAQTNPSGSAPFDLTQQAKLRDDLGTWRCVSAATPTTPLLSLTETEQGNWFVARETGAEPATSYERWSHTLKAYILITIFDSGASNVSQTTSPDPDNGTWTPMWPALDNQGRKRFANQVSRTGDVIRSSTPFYDDKGNVQTGTDICTKQ
jgi:hypothetical protein